jgi:hypothetical protein
MNDIDNILIEIRQLNNQWLDLAFRFMPDLIQSRRKPNNQFKVFFHSVVFECISWIMPMFHMNNIPKYIFHGLRHRALLEILPRSEVLVLGGRNEYMYCLQKGYRFHWIGYISKSFQLYIFENKKQPFFRFIKYIRNLFLNKIKSNTYLFLWEDTQPTGLTLSVALRSIPNLNIVCVAHGMFLRYKNEFVPAEGQQCKFNLVWAESQKKMFKEKNGCATFVLGLPYDVKPSSKLSRNVVLIGHCGLDGEKIEYFYSLYHFCKIFTVLDKAGFNVSYRPHPQDNVNFVKSIFSKVSFEDKNTALALERRIYIGFMSSMLFEASKFGNIVIGLDCSPILPIELDFDLDGYIIESNYPNLPEYLLSLLTKFSKIDDKQIDDFPKRFYNCIEQIDEFNLKSINKIN